MALIAKTVKVPINDKLTGHEYLQGRTIKIFANPVVISTYAVRRRDGITKQFSGICNWLI